MHSQFADAIADCGLVVGTSARQRYLQWELVEPRECAQRVVNASRLSHVALVFGAERTGLTNDELELCNLLVTIPTHPGYASLNVAMAVQLLTYEVWLAQRDGTPPQPERDVPLATADEMTRLYEHIERVLQDIDFQDRTGGGHLMARIRRLFNRAQLDQNEMNILRGIPPLCNQNAIGPVSEKNSHQDGLHEHRTAVYLDNAATTPVDPRVAVPMSQILTATGGHGNPSSIGHSYGRRARDWVESARAQVANLIAARPEGIVFTSGATESNNLAILGAARFQAGADKSGKRHLVSSRTEHKAVLGPMQQLEREGFEVTYLKPDVTGIVHPQQIAGALRDDTLLVSLMHVNNEIGVIQEVGSVGQLCRDRGVLLHVDAAQSVGKLPINVEAMQIDLLSMTAHKMYGPKGIGALYVRPKRRWD